MHLQSSSKFLELLKSAGKRVFYSRDSVAPGECPGIYRLGSLGTHGAPGECPGDLPVGALGTRGRGTEMEAGVSSSAVNLARESSAGLGEAVYALGARR